MRTGLLSFVFGAVFFAGAVSLVDTGAWAQTTEGPIIPGLRPPDATGPQDVGARRDADRYYWNKGQWWYWTPQNTWLRWNGDTWVQAVRASKPGVQPQPYVARYTPQRVAAPSPSYRYHVNDQRAGL
jgi:hypothetical protein